MAWNYRIDSVATRHAAREKRDMTAIPREGELIPADGLCRVYRPGQPSRIVERRVPIAFRHTTQKERG